jgi:hypothetical protein
MVRVDRNEWECGKNYHRCRDGTPPRRLGHEWKCESDITAGVPVGAGMAVNHHLSWTIGTFSTLAVSKGIEYPGAVVVLALNFWDTVEMS